MELKKTEELSDEMMKSVSGGVVRIAGERTVTAVNVELPTPKPITGDFDHNDMIEGRGRKKMAGADPAGEAERAAIATVR